MRPKTLPIWFLFFLAAGGIQNKYTVGIVEGILPRDPPSFSFVHQGADDEQFAFAKRIVI
jgi:hypothetical protein